MDAKKIERLLTPEKREKKTVRVTLSVSEAVYGRMQAKYPRNRRPSIAEVTETLWARYLDEIGKKKG
jgi:hypothetical protein